MSGGKIRYLPVSCRACLPITVDDKFVCSRASGEGMRGWGGFRMAELEQIRRGGGRGRVYRDWEYGMFKMEEREMEWSDVVIIDGCGWRLENWRLKCMRDQFSA